MRHGDEQCGGSEAAHHAGEYHVPRPEHEGDEDGDDAADEESAAVEGVDEDGLGREERQGAAYSEGVGLKRKTTFRARNVKMMSTCHDDSI